MPGRHMAGSIPGRRLPPRAPAASTKEIGMHISQILRTKRSDVVVISPDATIRSAIALMTLERVGALVVVDEDQHLLGVVCERDIIQSLDLEGTDLMSILVRKVMRTDAPLATLEDSLRS